MISMAIHPTDHEKPTMKHLPLQVPIFDHETPTKKFRSNKDVILVIKCLALGEQTSDFSGVPIPTGPF